MRRHATKTTHQPVITLLAVGALAAAASAVQADDEHLPAAATLLDKHVEATGGKKAHLALKTRKRTGKLAVSMAGHEFEAKIEEHYLAPDKSHVLIDGDFFAQVTVSNGKNAWEWRPGHVNPGEDAGANAGETELLEGGEKARAIEKGHFHAAVLWRERFEKVETLRVVDVNERPAYEVKVETKDGEEYSQFYDKGNGRLVRILRTLERHGEELAMDTHVGRYREFDGVRIATEVTAYLKSPSMGEGTQTWTYSKIEHPEKIPASLFAMPEELRELAKKADGGGE